MFYGGGRQMYMSERITVIHTFVMLIFSIWWENIFIKVVLLYNVHWLMCYTLFDLYSLQHFHSHLLIRY